MWLATMRRSSLCWEFLDSQECCILTWQQGALGSCHEAPQPIHPSSIHTPRPSTHQNSYPLATLDKGAHSGMVCPSEEDRAGPGREKIWGTWVPSSWTGREGVWLWLGAPPGPTYSFLMHSWRRARMGPSKWSSGREVQLRLARINSKS